jgi:hypothetical protein
MLVALKKRGRKRHDANADIPPTRDATLERLAAVKPLTNARTCKALDAEPA